MTKLGFALSHSRGVFCPFLSHRVRIDIIYQFQFVNHFILLLDVLAELALAEARKAMKIVYLDRYENNTFFYIWHATLAYDRDAHIYFNYRLYVMKRKQSINGNE